MIFVQVGLEVGDVKLWMCASTIQYTNSDPEGTPLFLSKNRVSISKKNRHSSYHPQSTLQSLGKKPLKMGNTPKKCKILLKDAEK
jgi:hypothetical protein